MDKHPLYRGEYLLKPYPQGGDYLVAVRQPSDVQSMACIRQHKM